jgi:hypothetical protein
MRQLLSHGVDISVKCKIDGIHGISMSILLTVRECRRKLHIHNMAK